MQVDGKSYPYNKKLDIARRITGHKLLETVTDPMTGEVVAEADTMLTREKATEISARGIKNGCTVPGFAFWAGVQATQLAGFTHRHRILALVRPDGCCAYAIPVPKLEGTFNLPDIELTAGELDSL